jgi:hypothetical protein
MRRLLSLVALLALGACAPDEREAPPSLPLRLLETPAREGSGESFLSSDEDGVLLSWIERIPGGGHQLRVARLGADLVWTAVNTVSQGDDFFVNWADFPSVVQGAGGRIWAHWLQREEGEGLAYAIRITHSADGGTTWADPWTPHEDGTRTEHGFVTLFPWGEGIGVTWLDGRKYAPGPAGEAPTREMTVRFREVGPDGAGPEVLLDPRTCDCCQTDVAVASTGPVMVYRDRTAEEVRDIYVTRWTADGWTEGVPVHDDGWVIAGCPVNGPAVDAHGDRVAVAWFTGSGDEPRVNVAFSTDAGRSFGQPIRLDGGNPSGRVDLRMEGDSTVLVTWLERTEGDAAEIRMARVSPGGGAADYVVASSSSARASGFPRMALAPWVPGAVLLTWTDVSDPDASVVRVALVEVPR